MDKPWKIIICVTGPAIKVEFQHIENLEKEDMVETLLQGLQAQMSTCMETAPDDPAIHEALVKLTEAFTSLGTVLKHDHPPIEGRN